MSTDLHFSRVRLRQDPDMRALAPLLLPPDGEDRTHAGHRLVWSLFADDPDRKRDFLWRDDGHGRWFVLSARPPRDQAGLFVVETKPFRVELSAGDRLAFALRANPVVQRRTPEGRAVRHDVVMDALHGVPRVQRADMRQRLIQEAGLAWLARQADGAGFVFPVAPRADGYEAIRIPRVGQGDMRFSVLQFEGLLEVRDPHRFVEKLATGFGRARGFGCGLMLVKRA